MSTKAIKKWLNPKPDLTHQPTPEEKEDKQSPSTSVDISCEEDNLLRAFRPQWKGVVKKEGHLVKNWKERFFVIIKDVMLYYKTERDYTLGVSPVGYHVVQEVVESPSSVNIITVTGQCKKIFKLEASRGNGLLQALQQACVVTATSDQTLQYAGHPQLQLVRHLYNTYCL